MRIFLSGGTGFIGGYLASQCLADGHEVVALRRPGASSRIHLGREPEWREGYMTDNWREVLADCDVLVHLAANGVAAGPNDWEGCFEVNLRQSLHLWRQAVASGVRRFLIVGSCFEYGLSGERYDYIPVTASLEPTTAYGASKAAATVAAHALALEHRLSLVIARPFHVYGEGEDPCRFWPSLVRAAQQGSDFSMTQGEQVRDFQHVTTTVAQLAKLLQFANVQPGRPLLVNLGTSQPMSLKAFAEREWSRLGAVGTIKFGVIPSRDNEVMRYVPEVGNLLLL
jgi:UDP-glucose 4-epimerase